MVAGGRADRGPAREKVAALRTEAQSTPRRPTPTVSELNSDDPVGARADRRPGGELRQQAESLREETFSTVAELNAEADALTLQDIEGEYSMSLQQAQVVRERRAGRGERPAGRWRSSAHRRSAPRCERRFAELEASEATTRAAYDEAIDNIESTSRTSLAKIDVQRAEAEKIEKSARAKFVKAEVDARVAAIIEESTHQSELAEDEFEQIRAAAEAEAAKLADEAPPPDRQGAQEREGLDEPEEPR
jgi:hypothetical protein